MALQSQRRKRASLFGCFALRHANAEITKCGYPTFAYGLFGDFMNCRQHATDAARRGIAFQRRPLGLKEPSRLGARYV